MAGAGFFFNQFNLTEQELTVSIMWVFRCLKFLILLQKVSEFLGAMNVMRAKGDKPAMQPDEACKFMLATNFDVNASVELARNYEVQSYNYYTKFYAVT